MGMHDTFPEDRTGWTFDRRINVSTLLSALTSLAVAVGLIVSLDARLDAVEAQAETIKSEVREARATVIRVERIDERMEAMQRVLEEIKEDLRQQRRRTS